MDEKEQYQKYVQKTFNIDNHLKKSKIKKKNKKEKGKKKVKNKKLYIINGRILDK